MSPVYSIFISDGPDGPNHCYLVTNEKRRSVAVILAK